MNRQTKIKGMKGASSVTAKNATWEGAALLLGCLLYPSITAQPAKMPPSLEACAAEPAKYTGAAQTDKWFFDGAIRHAVGAHRYQVFRANRTHPREGGDSGWTYNHQPFLAYWNNQFYLEYLSNPFEEHNPPGRTLLMTSNDGRTWSDPKIIFPVYKLPEIAEGNGNPPGKYLWITYSVNKEDIWISRVTVPISVTVDRHVNDSFEDVASVADLDLWSLHVPKWAPISIAVNPVTRTKKCLELRDEDPYDQAVAERTFPVDGEFQPSGLYIEDLPGADTKTPASAFLIDDVRTK